MFKSIVVAFDGSVCASRALEIGAELAAQANSDLGIIYAIDSSHMQVPATAIKMSEVEHLIDPVPKTRIDFNNTPSSLMSAMAQSHAETERTLYQYADFLLGQANQVALDLGVSQVEVKALVGNPAETIAAYAKDRHADLIVVGCRGFGKFKRLLLGSTSHKLSQLANCSCLTVK